MKNKHINRLENLTINALKIFNNEGYIPTMNKSSIDNIIGFPNIKKRRLRIKEKKNIFTSMFARSESYKNNQIFIY